MHKVDSLTGYSGKCSMHIGTKMKVGPCGNQGCGNL